MTGAPMLEGLPLRLVILEYCVFERMLFDNLTIPLIELARARRRARASSMPDALDTLVAVCDAVRPTRSGAGPRCAAC